MSTVHPLARTDLPDPNAPATRGSNKLGKDEFLKLLMTQLSSQDPTSPTNSEAFVAQLAQFAALEQQQAANNSLDNLLLAQASANQTAMANFVGKDVTFKTDTLAFAGGEPAKAEAHLKSAASSMTAVVTDASGRAVRTIKLPAQEPGTVAISWDGRDDFGNQLAPGNYKLRVTAADKDGASVPVDQRSSGHVQGVAFEEGVAVLKTSSGTRVPISDVLEIKERTTP